MPTVPATNTRTATSPSDGGDYAGAMAMVTTLFFFWGFVTVLNDILVPHLKGIFDLSYTKVMLIQFAFFSAYFIFSIPAAKIIDAIGYQRTMVTGLITMGLGAFLFYPAANAPSYPLFLGALMVLAAGITLLQVAANPYVAVLGKPQTASSRLNLTQAFNSLGTAIFPWIGAHLILRSETASMAQNASQQADAVIKLYVYFFSIVLALLAVSIG